jgi:hypothetical protein
MNYKDLSRPLDISDIEFRVQSINNGGYATILAYKNARVDMSRLDEVVGPMGWQRKHELINGKLFCHVGLYSDMIDQWIWKSDVGTESMTEASKGESSDSFKRACFNWGIGRELYEYPFISIHLEAHEWDNKSGRPKQTYNLKIKDWRWYSEFNEKGSLSFLAAKDENGKVRFKWGEMKPKDVEPEYKKATEVVTEEEAHQPVIIAEEPNVQGVLKKKNIEVDEERELLCQEYLRILGSKPHGKMSKENIKKAIDEAIDKQLEPEEIESVPEVEQVVDEEVETKAAGSIKDFYPVIESFKEPKNFISWAKEVVLNFIDIESEENIEEFKTLCNNHYLNNLMK